VHGFRRTFHLHVDEQADSDQLAELTSALTVTPSGIPA